MDSETDDLKELVKRQGKQIEDTNRVVHKMLRAQRWERVFRIVWWLAVAGVLGYVYYYYLLPYLEQILALYGDAQGFGEQFKDFFTNFRPGQ